jgi:CDP-diacylglycerol---serine O-phosphatidyltransferase
LKIKSHIPNTLTLLNLFSGVAGIIWVLDGQLMFGAYFVFIAAGFDFLDGFVARLLKVQSEIGKELDSLADVVSFGVLPGIILFSLVKEQSELEWLPYLTLIVPMLSAYRLAKFNLDTRQTDQFIGLPTPANALFISTLPHLALEFQSFGNWLTSPWIMVIVAWVFAILLILELPLIALKFKNFSFKDNKIRFTLIGLGIASFAWMQLAGIPLLILAYIALSILEQAIGSE